MECTDMALVTASAPAGKRHRSGNERLLLEIDGFCRSFGMAESTFGRRAVNDGKFVGRLRFGGRVTTQTADRVRAFISRYAPPMAKSTVAGATGATAASTASHQEEAAPVPPRVPEKRGVG